MYARGGLTGLRPGTLRLRRIRLRTRAVDSARSATSRSVASYRRTSAGARASSPAAVRTARSTEVGTLTPPVTLGRDQYGPVDQVDRLPRVSANDGERWQARRTGAPPGTKLTGSEVTAA